MNYTLKQLSDALAAGQMSSRELTRDYLARIDALNPQLNAFITVDHHGALAAADAADAARAAGQAGALTGIPFAHKDVFVTEGLRTTCGSKMRGKDERCKNRPSEGQKRCHRHGASTPQALAKVAKNKAKDALEKEMVMLGIRDTYDTVDPGEALLEAIAMTYSEVKWLESRVKELSPQDASWGLAQTREGVGPEGPIDERTEKAMEHVLITQLRDARDRLVKYSALALKAGIEERRVQLAESQAVAVAGVIQRILSRLNLTETQAADVSLIVPEELRALEGDPDR